MAPSNAEGSYHRAGSEGPLEQRRGRQLDTNQYPKSQRSATTAVAVLICGPLFRRPESRTSKAGAAYVTATIKVIAGSELQFWNVTAFSKGMQDELLRLDAGDSIAAQGIGKIGLYTKDDGETRLSLGLVVDQIIPLRQPPRERDAKPRAKSPDLRSSLKSSVHARADFDDDIPFGGART